MRWVVLAALLHGLVFIASASFAGSDEIVVQLAASASDRDARLARARLAERLAGLGLEVERSFLDGMPERTRVASSAQNPFDLAPERIWLLSLREAASADSALLALGADPSFDWAEPNVTRVPAVSDEAPFPNDPLFRDGRQWGLRNLAPAGPYGGAPGADIGVLDAWALSRGANDLRLAVADTGVDPAHPDLATTLRDGTTRIVLGLNVTAEASRSFADSLGHGTPVAGVMAALSGDGPHFDTLGVAGVCGGDGGANIGCRIVPIKIAPGHSSLARSFDIARAIVYATDVGARALNLSFAGTAPSRLERQALYYAITRGCVVVAASGNRGFSAGSAPNYPAAYAADGLCIQVGASDSYDRRAAFSSYGPGLDIVAPGENVWSTSITYPAPSGATTHGYVAASGTSFAAPFATGVVGLLVASRPELGDVDLQHILRESAADLGEPGVDLETGWGRLDAGAALRAVDPAFGIWHDEVSAEHFRVVARESLTVGETGPGALAAGLYEDARLIEVTATVVLPDSFTGAVRVWPRVGGTMTVRPGFHLPYFAPWAEVVAADHRTFTLRGFAYAIEDGLTLPLPLDQARFGFTVIARVHRATAAPTATPAPLISIAPNPFHHRLALSGPSGAVLRLTDISGRLVRRLSLDATGAAVWDARDRAGRIVRPGLYLLIAEAGSKRSLTKVLKLE